MDWGHPDTAMAYEGFSQRAVRENLTKTTCGVGPDYRLPGLCTRVNILSDLISKYPASLYMPLTL